MIVSNTNSGAITTVGTITSNQLMIKASGKAFKAMIDSIYKDKPGSIVRELATNALDGHREAGNVERPFVIHVPDVYEPYFAIRDYGCSMSPEQITNVYSVLFESTKDNSNDKVGGYGLGGKNFLAYQDSGTIISYYNGKKYNYVLMYDDSGVPSMHQMGIEDTVEENGLYVEVAIKDGDYHLFNNAIVNQLRWLKVKPILNNNSANISIDTPVIDKMYGNFGVFSEAHPHPRGFWIVQGEVGYPLNITELEEHIKNKEALEFFRVQNGGVLFFDIGDIHVTLSREDVQYNAHTVASIEKFIGEVAPLIYKDTVDMIASFNTTWDKLAYINSDIKNFKLCKMASIDISDNNAKIYAGNHKYQIDTNFLSSPSGSFSICEYKSAKRHYATGNSVVIPNHNIEFFIRDIGRGGIARIKWYEQSSPKQVRMIEHRQGSEHITDKIIQDISDRLGGITIKRISTLPEPPKNSYSKNGSPVVYQWMDGDSLDKVSKWERIYDEEEIETGYYLTFEAYPHIVMPYVGISILKNLLKKGGKLYDVNLYAIKESKKDLFKSNANMIPIEDVIREVEKEIKDKYENQTFIKRYAMAQLLQQKTETILSNLNIRHMAEKEKKRLIDAKHPLGTVHRINEITSRYIKKVSKKRIDKLDQIEKDFFTDAYNKSFGKTDVSTIALPDSKKMLKKYPQLGWLGTNWGLSAEVSRQVVEYINLIDGLTKDEE